jgi:hypothetical protein
MTPAPTATATAAGRAVRRGGRRGGPAKPLPPRDRRTTVWPRAGSAGIAGSGFAPGVSRIAIARATTTTTAVRDDACRRLDGEQRNMEHDHPPDPATAPPDESCHPSRRFPRR